MPNFCELPIAAPFTVITQSTAVIRSQGEGGWVPGAGLLPGGWGPCVLRAEGERRPVGLLRRRLVPAALQQLAEGETRTEACVGVGRRQRAPVGVARPGLVAEPLLQQAPQAEQRPWSVCRVPGGGGLLVHVRRLRELPELLEQGAQAEGSRRRGLGMRGGHRRLVGSPGGGGVAEGQCELGQLDRCVRACILV